MSVPSESNGRPSSPQEAAGVLSNLPRTRPQRSTARRAAARDEIAASAAAQAPDSASTTPRKRAAKRAVAKTDSAVEAPPARKAATKAKARKAPQRPSSAAAPVSEPVPAQGFETEGDHLHGTVHPPSGTELIGSAGEILGELAKAGISAGERLLRDVLSHLPLS
ncbi:MAG TPA: hypothetical protein VFD88_13055 [Clostridia bacterium]|nr:hypothetical protein [Clostridia bacterium]